MDFTLSSFLYARMHANEDRQSVILFHKTNTVSTADSSEKETEYNGPPSKTPKHLYTSNRYVHKQQICAISLRALVIITDPALLESTTAPWASVFSANPGPP